MRPYRLSIVLLCLSACASGISATSEPDRASASASSGQSDNSSQSAPAAETNPSGTKTPAIAGTSGRGEKPPGKNDAPQARASQCSDKRGRAGDFTRQLDVQGVSRSFLLHVPASYDPGQVTPLVLTFHGKGSEADGAAYISQMTNSSDARGFIVAYPNGAGANWNCCNNTGSDDVAFADALIEAISDDYCVQPSHVFAAGYSNGGYMAYRLMCELSARITAIAVIEGGLAIQSCKPSRPIAVIQFHGTSDEPVPYAEGVQANQRARELNECASESSIVYDRGDVTCELWPACAKASAVELCTIEGGGHQWPGGGEIDCLGHLSQDIDATDAIGDFFAAH
jgi:polyhydroxybutyrate depolymerase